MRIVDLKGSGLARLCKDKDGRGRSKLGVNPAYPCEE